MDIKKIKAVFFDLDGTLIDTEKYYRVCWPKAFEYFGYHIVEEQYLSLRSLGKPYIQERMQSWFGKDVECEEIRKLVRVLVNDMIKENGLQLKKGVVECLNFLNDNNVPRAIVTATSLDRTEKKIKSANIKKYFQYIISATEVEHGKPAPDVYLYAANEVGFEPKDIIAVEDSPNGANSAIAAGLNVIMVPDLTEPDSELESKLFAKLKSLDDFQNLIKEKNIVFN